MKPMWASFNFNVASLVHTFLCKFFYHHHGYDLGIHGGTIHQKNSYSDFAILTTFISDQLQYVTLRAVTSTPTLHTCNTASSCKVHELFKGVWYWILTFKLFSKSRKKMSYSFYYLFGPPALTKHWQLCCWTMAMFHIWLHIILIHF